MTKFEIRLSDWQRILFGQTPPFFLIEVFFRTVIVYLFLLCVLRWLGKRMSGQLTILEMAVMLTLGAIVSVGMQVPDRGITLSMFVLCCTLAFHKGLSWWGIRSARIEELSQGTISTLVKDGVMDLEEMRKCRISPQQLFSQLRNQSIYNLGSVRRVYLEACGIFSIYQTKTSHPGLPTLPPNDGRFDGLLHYAGKMVCSDCGNVNRQNTQPVECPNCGSKNWTEAIGN